MAGVELWLADDFGFLSELRVVTDECEEARLTGEGTSVATCAGLGGETIEAIVSTLIRVKSSSMLRCVYIGGKRYEVICLVEPL